MNDRNPVPGLGEYRTTAPCAEVGLIEGETCQFGYVNVANFVRPTDGVAAIDYERLQPVVQTLLHGLDNALEVSARQFLTARSRYVTAEKRKIGIGLCGVADALTLMGLPYEARQAQTLMQEVLSFINYASKEESVRLAEQRGPCGAMRGFVRNRHLEKPYHLERLYADSPTSTVDAQAWRGLARCIAERRQLRNISTIALPPTGRSALVIEASTGIEPHFSIAHANSRVHRAIDARMPDHDTAACVAANAYRPTPEIWHLPVRRLLAGAADIDPAAHVGMAAALQRYTDEAISKTINLPEGSSPADIKAIYLGARAAGMSGVTIYVDGTHRQQPIMTK